MGKDTLCKQRKKAEVVILTSDEMTSRQGVLLEIQKDISYDKRVSTSVRHKSLQCTCP